MVRKNIVYDMLIYARPYRNKYFVLLLLILIISLTAAVSPYLFKVIIDEGIGKNNLRLVILLISAIFCLELLSGIGEVLRARLSSSVGQSILIDVRNAIFAHLSRMSPSFYTNHPTGELMARLEGDVAFLEATITQGILTLASDVIYFAVIAGFVFFLSWKLFLSIIVLIPIAFILQKAIATKINQIVVRLRDSAASLGAFLQEAISNMRYFQAFAAEPNLQEKYGAKMRAYADANIELNTAIYSVMAAMGLIGAIGAIIVYSYGGYFVISKKLTIGGLITFTAYFNRLLGPAQRLAKVNIDLKASEAALLRVKEILGIDPEIKALGSIRVKVAECKIEFKNVGFSFVTNKPVFENLNLSIDPNSTNLILGLSGVGKTTISNLLVRHYDVSEGSILFNGIDIRDLDLNHLRKQVGIISQDAFLLNVSIKENIAFAKPEASDEQIIEAAKAARIYDYISSLPEGFDTVIGERGFKLSGGQKQRIAIARAILQDPALLILDESTSALDLKTELEVMNELKPFFAERTVIIISHRFPNLDIVDKVMELKEKQAHEIDGHFDGTIGSIFSGEGKLGNASYDLADRYV